MDELNGKAAVVTGASRGIGAAAAEELAGRGVGVVLAARSMGACEALAAKITDAGGRAYAVQCDVARYEDVAAAVERCVALEGRIDILVNNAGLIDPISHLASSDPDGWTQAFQVNAVGIYNGLRAALPVMLSAGGGVVVNVSSGAGVNPMEGWSHYCASKAAGLMLTRCAHKEVGERGVRVVGFSPGTVATDMQRSIKSSGINPVSTLDWEDHIAPQTAARAIAYLCTEAAADLSGTDFSIKTEEGRRRAGLAA